MPLNNPFLSYIGRSYEQIKQAALNYLAILTPEITDNNDSNILVRMLNVWAGIAEMIGYYVDNMAREQFLSNCRLYWSAIKIARQYDYRVASSQAASVRIKFTYQNTGTSAFTGVNIPAGTQIQTDTGIIFTTVEDLILPPSTLNTIEGFVDAVNTTQVTGLSLGTSDGTANQEFVIDDAVGGFSVTTIVGGVTVWSSQETLAYSIPTDQDFVQTVNESKKVIIRFGDGVAGAIPNLSDTIEVNYTRTDGEDGNVDANTLTTAVGAIPTPSGFTLTITNPDRASGGATVESLTSLKRNIPRLIRTKNRAVTEQDFIDIGNLHPQVQQTSVVFECGKTVDVYIVPIGGGIAASTLVTDVENWYDPRKIITTNLNVFPAGEIRLQLQITLRVLANYIQADVVSNVRTNLLDFFSPENQQIGGTVHVGDIYEVIENTQGVSSSTVVSLVPVPYARPSAANINQVLAWTRAIQPANTSTDFWEIKFTAATTFQLLKNNNFLGSFSTGTTITQPEIVFTVTGTYSIPDTFTFYTYPYSSNDLDLQEQSIPTALTADILINPIGGV